MPAFELWENLVKEALANRTEYSSIDFKLNLSEKNERLKEHVNAFGNLDQGGCFVFGVNEEFVPVGIENWEKIIEKLSHIAHDTQDPKLTIQHFPVHVNEKKLLCIHVLPSSSKPVFVADRAPWSGKACFKRSGSSTLAMSSEEIRALLANTTQVFYDESFLENTELDELDFDKLASFLPLDKNEKWSFRNLAVLMDTRILCGQKTNPKITAAGWLCFAKNPQAKREFRNAHIEFQIFQGNLRDFPIKKYLINGGLPEQIEKAIEVLKQNTWVVPKIQGNKREDIPAYSEIVLREIITNTIVHRDYQKMHQPIKIALFENRVEIENPGGLMPGLTVFNFVHKRDWRNPLLAELMKKFGFGEMDGQGIDRLYAATLEIKVPPPIFSSNENSFIAILSAPKSFEKFSIEEKRLMLFILAIVQEQNLIENESIRNCFAISSEQASTLIKQMMADKIIEPKNSSRKYAKYALTREYREKIFS